jgi:NTP pyrophosphatase (non-canonical NTP hydrolase)
MPPQRIGSSTARRGVTAYSFSRLFMNFDEYQSAARQTAQYPNMGSNFYYPTLGLAGEAGEVAEKVKKLMRDHGGVMSPERRDALKKELGDVLWYVAALCSELNLTMSEVAEHNIAKLRDRRQRDAIRGEGDNR